MSRKTVSGPARAQAAGPVRERILDAALALLREGGIQRLTQVRAATRAGVRQSHLTYYFPTRPDLLEATTMRFVDALAGDIGRTVGGRVHVGTRSMLAHLARAVAETEHMRMFLGLIVEADEDPALRAIIVRGAVRLEAALADALGGADHAAQARAVLATMWGLGLYAFVVRPPPRKDPARTALVWLEAALS